MGKALNSKPVPILLLVRELDLGGCERDLCKIAMGVDRSRFMPHVGCFRPNGLRATELRAAGIPIVSFPVHSLMSRAAVSGMLQMGRYIQRHGIQIVHAWDVPTCVYALPIARLFRVRAVIGSQLSYRHLCPPSMRALLRVSDRMVDAMVVNCNAMLRHMVDDEQFPPAQTYVCYNGVDTRVFHPAPPPPIPALQGSSVVIGSVCALRAEKRLDLLLDAFARVRHLRPGLKLAIVGSGTMLPALEEQSRRLNLGDSCHFEPATGDVASWMRAMDIFVLPSASEAFSNALLEAMATGCAVVGSRVGGTPELIEDGSRGLLFEPADTAELAGHLALLIRENALRKRLAEAATRFAHGSLSLDLALQRIQDLYTQLLQPR
jgi:L-malate glycosyltransferase